MNRQPRAYNLLLHMQQKVVSPGSEVQSAKLVRKILTPTLSPSEGEREKISRRPARSPDGDATLIARSDSLSPSDGERVRVGTMTTHGLQNSDNTWVTLPMFSRLSPSSIENCCTPQRKPLKARNTGFALRGTAIRPRGHTTLSCCAYRMKCYPCLVIQLLPMCCHHAVRGAFDCMLTAQRFTEFFLRAPSFLGGLNVLFMGFRSAVSRLRCLRFSMGRRISAATISSDSEQALRPAARVRGSRRKFPARSI